jgi:putative N-acetylmannosamine-6-phosphate epimerase
MKTVLKLLSVLVIGVIAYYYIQSEIYKSEMRENSLRIQNEIDRQNKIFSLDSADRERRRAEEMAQLKLDILRKK